MGKVVQTQKKLVRVNYCPWRSENSHHERTFGAETSMQHQKSIAGWEKSINARKPKESYRALVLSLSFEKLDSNNSKQKIVQRILKLKAEIINWRYQKIPEEKPLAVKIFDQE